MAQTSTPMGELVSRDIHRQSLCPTTTPRFSRGSAPSLPRRAGPSSPPCPRPRRRPPCPRPRRRPPCPRP
eukprot:2212218-Pyramimonas_sp.AAC.1